MNLTGSRFFKLEVGGSLESTLDNLTSKIKPLLEGPGPYYIYAGSRDGISIRELLHD
ncbi:MAG: hypothetical protein F7C08_01290 [Desulfurococcales archaeon]|nr:hypothetical protein [Desulfurococcales archaeon]MCE4605153.1 hypothetical protein [Desulfurococcales archaeon]